ncbi:MAG: type II toxin-antitoxin system VapC family toxin [Bryobacteraceae bacterium]|jgi:predicted nucleic acid-binding protein
MAGTCLLDSGILIDALNGKRGRRELLDRLIEDGADMACCSINVTEIYAGLRPGEEAKTERLLRSLKFYPVTWEIAKQAGELQNVWRQPQRTLSLPDTTIAAVALANDLTLVTGNLKDFPMQELRLYPLP